MSLVLKLRHLSAESVKKCLFFADFQNAVFSQPIDGFLFSTPEMKARDAYVPFLLSKPLNKMYISELSSDIS